MTLAEFFGYLASVLVFLSFYMKTMVALRCAAILSNFAFITYAALEGLAPVLILHVLLLPTNIVRLHQIQRLLKDTATFREAGFPLEPLVPFMQERPVRRGEVLFSKGERSTEMFYLAKGRVRITEVGALLQPGEIFGEISLFAPDNRRTGTAVAEESGIVFQLSEKAVLQIFYQNPQMGFSLIRIITGRLIENYRRLEDERQAAAEGNPASAQPGATLAGPAPPPVLPDARKVAEAETVLKQARHRRRLALALLVLVPLALLLGAVGSQRSYFASVLYRDAVVTTWAYLATAPISGQVLKPVPVPGDVVRAVDSAGEGPVLRIRDLQADDTRVAHFEAESRRMGERVAHLQAQLDELEDTAARWKRRSAIYGEVFRDSIEAELAGLEAEMDFVGRQRELSARVSSRLATLAAKGNASRSTADERMAETMELASREKQLEKQIRLTRRRAEAAGKGVFVAADGSNPDWVYDSDDVLELRLIESADALAEATAALARLAAERKAAEAHLTRSSVAEVSAPAGSLVWSVAVAPGATVARGAPLVEWIDCRRPLVDVPVSEVAVALLPPGTAAEVRIDGLEGALGGEVVYVRGAAARLGRDVLAAVAGGHEAGDAQVLVALDPGLFEAGDCPVGRAAFVDFPEVGPLRRLLASLRL